MCAPVVSKCGWFELCCVCVVLGGAASAVELAVLDETEMR